ncbi:MAG: hypothetical protein ACPHRO_02540, partial [Nannocystaceae bacterium]
RLLEGAIGDRILAAIVDEAGALWRFDGARWSPNQLSPEEVAGVRALAVSAGGEVFAVSDTVLHVWNGEVWDRIELPAKLQNRPLALAASPGGRLYLGSQGDTIWVFNGRKFDRLVYAGIDVEVMNSEVEDLQYQAIENAVWFVTKSGFLTRVDIGAGIGRDWRLPAPGTGDTAQSGRDPWQLFGYEKPGGYQVFVTRNSAIYSYQGDRVVWRGEASDSVEVVWPESGGRRLAVATRAGSLERLDGTLRREDVQYVLSPKEEQRADRAAQRRPPPRILKEGRLVPDIGLRLGGTVNLAGNRGASSFRLEAGLGVLVAPVAPSSKGIAFWIWPRAGYKLDTNARGTQPGFFGDVGLGVGNALLLGAAHIGALVDFYERATSVGVRYSGGLYAVWGTVGIEAHLEEITPTSERMRSMSVLFSLNIAPVLWLASVLNER